MKFDWAQKTLGDLGNIITGKTPSTKIADYWNGDIPFVTPKDIQATKHILSTERTVSSEGLKAVRGSMLPESAVCVSCIGNIGYLGITTKTSVSNQQINSIIVNKDNDANFVYYLLKSLWPFFKNYEGQSTALSILNKTQFSKISVLVPEFNIQKKIASVLSALDDKIELNTRINDNLAQQAQAIYEDMFITHANPGWGKGRLSDLVAVKYGKDHKKLADGEIPVYGSGGIMRYVERPIYTRESVLIPRKGTLNHVMYVSEPFWSVDTMFYTEMLRPDIAKFVYHFISGKNLASMNAGSAIPSMTTDILNAMELSIPDNDTLSAFEKVVSPMYQTMLANRKQSENLAKLRDALLPRLMSGELDVSEIEL